VKSRRGRSAERREEADEAGAGRREKQTKQKSMAEQRSGMKVQRDRE